MCIDDCLNSQAQFSIVRKVLCCWSYSNAIKVLRLPRVCVSTSVVVDSTFAFSLWINHFFFVIYCVRFYSANLKRMKKMLIPMKLWKHIQRTHLLLIYIDKEQFTFRWVEFSYFHSFSSTSKSSKNFAFCYNEWK